MPITIRTASSQSVVNSELDDHQMYSHAAALADGGYVIVWASDDQDGDQSGVYSQRYDAAGGKIGVETLVNATTAGWQGSPHVAGLADGGYIATWYTSGSPTGVLNYQRFDSTGARIGGESQVELGSGYVSSLFRAVGLADGGFVLAWAESTSTPSSTTYYIQRYDSAGAKAGAAVEIGLTGLSFSPVDISLSAGSDGGYVVRWTEPYRTVTQHFSATGEASAPIEWGNIYDLIVAPAANGGYAAVYSDGGRYYIQLLSEDGVAVGGPVEGPSGPYRYVSFTGLADGGFAATRYLYGREVQLFDSTGQATGPVVAVSEASGSDGTVVGLTGGGLVAVMAYGGSASSLSDVFQRFYSAPVASATLSAAVEVALGDGADDVFLVGPGALNPGDHIFGGGGQDTLQLTATGAYDFTGATLADVERIVGTAGDDELVFDGFPDGLVSLDSGGGRDVLRIEARTDLADLPALIGDWTVKGPNGPVTYYISGDYGGVHLDAGGAGIKIEAAGYALTAAEREALFADGVTHISQPGGYTFYSPTFATRPGEASQVNTAPNQEYARPAIARLGDGYVVVWSSSDTANSGKGSVYAQRYDAEGDKIGAQIVVVEAADGVVYRPPFVGEIAGGFVVTWSAAGFGTFSQQFDTNGQKIQAFPTKLSGAGDEPAVTAIPGGYIVSWSQENYHFFGQRFDNAGARVGDIQLINAPGATSGGDVAGLPDSGFIAVWRTGPGLIFQRFDSQGQKVGAQTAVDGTAGVVESDVAVLGAGQFVVAWAGESDGRAVVFSQRYDATGATLGARSQTGGGGLTSISVEALPDGGYIILWTAYEALASGGAQGQSAYPDFYSQRYDASGAPVGEEVRLNPTSAGDQSYGVATVLADGTVVSSWTQIEQYWVRGPIQLSHLQSVDFVTLTAGADTLAAANAPRLVTATAANFSATDSIIGGSSIDRLDLSSAGVLDLTAPSAFSGFEIIAGSGGDDRFIASTARLAGVTQLFGGAGQDVLQTSGAGILDLSGLAISGVETVEGSAGDDIIILDFASLSGVVAIVGGAGTDIVRLAGPTQAVFDQMLWSAVETLQGSASADIFHLSSYLPAGIGMIDGGGGADRVDFGWAAAGVTMAAGYVSIEQVIGSGFDDVLRAGSQGGSLSGEGGDDTLYGGSGADTLMAGLGNNLVYGGAGNDTISVALSSFAGSPVNTNRFYGEGGADNITGGLGADVLDGGDANDSLSGQAGDDVLLGGAGNDSMAGGDGNDILVGGIGNDGMRGDAGEDQLYGGAGNDILRDGGETANRDFLFGGPGNDTYYVTSSLTGPLDLIYEGGVDPDLAAGPNDLDVIHSAGTFFWDYYSVAETLYIDNVAGSQLIGGANAQMIFGNNGYDQIMVYGGSNRVDAGRGTDAISFGLYGLDESYDGVNTLVMKAGSGMDYVFEFESGVDKVDLSAFNFGITGAQVLAQAINIDNAGTDSDYCYFYLTSAGGVDNFVVFMGLLSSQLQASDFIT